jgi:colanic acid/amylovoran biosynthesis glycosyltransferase
MMIGAGAPPSSFIARQIAQLRSLGVDVATLDEPRSLKQARVRLIKRGNLMALGPRALSKVRSSDVLHVQWPGHLERYGGLARKYRKPVVLSLRGRQVNVLPYVPGHEGQAGRLRTLFQMVDGFHCVSQNILEEGMKYGLDPTRASVIRPAVDTSFFVPSPEARPEGPFKILMVGALIWRKGYEYALLALARLKASGRTFGASIIGSGEDEDRIRYTIDDLGLADCVSMLGRRTPEEIRAALWETDMFLHASVSEGIANVVIEAMACAVPVVVADSGGMREAITDDVEGFVVPPRDPDAMAERIERLADSSELAEKLGAGGRRRATEGFDLADQGRAFLDLYERVLQR